MTKLVTRRIQVYDNRTHQLKWRTIRVPQPERDAYATTPNAAFWKSVKGRMVKDET